MALSSNVEYLKQVQAENLKIIADKDDLIKSLKAQIAAKPKSKRPPPPPTVPQDLWDKALDEAPRVPGPLRWVLREKSKYGLVHDERVGEPSFTARYVMAKKGLRVRKAQDGTDGSKPEDWRHGSLTRQHDTPGMWWCKFDDAPDDEEHIDCGKNDLYDTNPLPPGKTGELVVQTTSHGYDMVSCRNPFTGQMFQDPKTNQTMSICFTQWTTVDEVRSKLETCCECINGLRLITPLQRVLDPFEDKRTMDEVLLLPPEDEDLDEKRLCLELYTVKPDGTQEMFWHS
jgi:uncharacterized cupredoxin-like copper-binding protein